MKCDDAFKARVNQAIDRGVKWLKGQQLRDGDFMRMEPNNEPYDLGIHGVQNDRLGGAALALYTLRICGVPADDACMVRGFTWARNQYDAVRDPRKASMGLRNYPVCLLVLALEAPRNMPEVSAGDEEQYGKSVKEKPAPPEADLAWMKELTRWILNAQDGQGGFGYMSPIQLAPHDHSNTQFSLLALAAAQRCGIQVPTKTWLKAMKHFLDCQDKDGPVLPRTEVKGVDEDGYGTTTGPGAPSRTGTAEKDQARGWGYRDGEPATGSMTAAGVCCLAACRSALAGQPEGEPRLLEQADLGIRDGLAWLGAHFSVSENPDPGHAPKARGWHYYYLFGLERAGDLAPARFVGIHDWYLEGAGYLLESQASNGSWASLSGLPPGFPAEARHLGGNFLDTCYALLFLKRAMLRSRGTATEEGLPDLSSASKLDDAAFRDLFDAVFRRFASASASGHAEAASDFVRLGTRSVPRLILRLEDGSDQTRAAAIAGLKQTTGLSQGFDPKAPEEARESAVRAWEEWWIAHKDRLVADVSAGRFLEK